MKYWPINNERWKLKNKQTNKQQQQQQQQTKTKQKQKQTKKTDFCFSLYQKLLWKQGGS